MYGWQGDEEDSSREKNDTRLGREEKRKKEAEELTRSSIKEEREKEESRNASTDAVLTEEEQEDAGQSCTDFLRKKRPRFPRRARAHARKKASHASFSASLSLESAERRLRRMKDS